MGGVEVLLVSEQRGFAPCPKYCDHWIEGQSMNDILVDSVARTDNDLGPPAKTTFRRPTLAARSASPKGAALGALHRLGTREMRAAPPRTKPAIALKTATISR